MRERRSRSQSIVYGVTVGKSAYGLLRGHLAWLREQGWNVTLVTSPDQAAERAAQREGVPIKPVNMKREIAPLQDIRSLIQWIALLFKLRPQAVNVGTPKASLLGGIAAWITRVPKRV